MISKAFILGAGHGSRLAPLTDYFPKPLVPFLGKPLAAHCLERCRAVGIDYFAINTHHLAQQWETSYQRGDLGDAPIQFFHEKTLLDSGGGLANIASFFEKNEDFLVCNGDINASLDLQKLIQAHQTNNCLVTLGLRSHGHHCNVFFDEKNQRILDVRHALGRAKGSHQFTGIYCASSALFEQLGSPRVFSIVPFWLELIKKNALAGVLLDEGHWEDIGTPQAYLTSHIKSLKGSNHLSQGTLIDPQSIVKTSYLYEDVTLTNVTLEKSIVWKGVHLSNQHLSHCIVLSDSMILPLSHSL